MPNKDESLIQAADFKSIRLNINLKNLTSQAEIRNGKRCYDNKETEENLQILISEFQDDGLVLEIPSKTCAQNHTIVIEIISENVNPKVKFSAHLKVIELEKLSSDADSIRTVFLDKNEADWKNLRNVYSKRQEEIRKFLNSVKGFEST